MKRQLEIKFKRQIFLDSGMLLKVRVYRSSFKELDDGRTLDQRYGG